MTCPKFHNNNPEQRQGKVATTVLLFKFKFQFQFQFHKTKKKIVRRGKDHYTKKVQKLVEKKNLYADPYYGGATSKSGLLIAACANRLLWPS